MLDANQTMVVAYTTSDGEILCAEHTEEAYGDEIRQYVGDFGLVEPKGTSFDLWKAFETVGLRAISRFELGEMESQNLHDLEATDLVEYLVRADELETFAADVIYQAAQGQPVYDVVETAWDNSMLDREHCGQDGEII